MKTLVLCAAAAAVQLVSANPVLPGYLTDPSVMKDAMASDSSYQPPARLKYPYVSTYYVKPTVTPDENVKVSFYVTDFEQSLVRFLDDSHTFTAFLEYRLKGGESKTVTLENLKSGDHAFNLGKFPVGAYEFRIWVKDQEGRESHRVIHDFRVMTAADLAIPADKVYKMTEADLAAYGIRNDGDFEKIVFVETNGTEKVVKDRRADAPGYTVTVPMDEKTGKFPWQAFKKAKVAYDKDYDRARVEADAVTTVEGIQKLIDDKATNGFRKVVMLPGVYRVSATKRIELPDFFTLDLGGAVIKENAFTGASSLMVKLGSTIDSHLVNGTLEGDYWTHDYAGSPNGSEWCSGVEIGGDSWYSSVENVKVADISGYGGQNGISKDKKGDLMFFYEYLPKFAPGGLDAATGEVDTNDTYRFTTDFKSLEKILAQGRTRLQVSKVLGYQGRATRSWQTTVAWYDAEKKFISAETSWQYREMWIPAGAQFVRVSVEDESEKAANDSGLRLTAMRIPVNCAVKACTFDLCRCVGYAASAMKNFLFEGNFFTRSGESAARCAFDAEDGWDQMQDVYFYGNVFRDNPLNNSILTCAGHNFILEKNECDVYLWGRTHSTCVRDNDISNATYRCDSRLRSGYGRFDGNRYTKSVELGLHESSDRPDNWDYVLANTVFDGEKDQYSISVGNAGRMVNCTFRNMAARISNAYACTFENCTDGNSYRGFPGGRWFECTVKDSKFGKLFEKYDWTRCHFTNVNLGGLYGQFAATDCDFADSSLFGLSRGKIRMKNCTLDRTTVGGNYWEYPAKLSFENCAITMREDAPFLKLGVYTVGRISFDGCSVTGKTSLVNVSDLRPISRQPNADPAENPDLRHGVISFKDTKWQSEAELVLQHDKVNPAHTSSKPISVVDAGNEWSEGVTVVTDLPEPWRLVSEIPGEFFNDVKIPMRDGVNLAGDLYLPSNRLEKIGCVLSFSPYKATGADTPYDAARAEEWGVATLAVDCRGLCHSEGVFEPWENRLVDDADDLLKWIAAQPWSNGRVVTVGGSYPGNTQLACLKSANPALVACAPSVVTFDPYSINYTESGVLIPEFFKKWHVGLAGEASYEELTKHTDRNDPYWTSRCDLRKLSEAKGRVLYQAGWFDMLGIDTFGSFAKMPEGSILRVGPWSHGVNTFDKPDVDYSGVKGANVTEDEEIEFLRTALDGFPSKTAKLPGKIQIFVMGANQWRYENEWPLARTVYRKLFFDEGLGLAFDAPKGAAGEDAFAYDPENPVPSLGGRIIGKGGQYKQNEIESRKDVISYTSEALAEDLEVTGDVMATIVAKSTAAVADVAVKLCDVTGDGRSYNVIDTVCRGAFAADAPTKLDFRVDITSYVFKKGHQLRVEIAGSNYPHYEKASEAATTTLVRGESFLTLPTIPAK